MINPPVIRSGEKLPHFNGSNDEQFFDREFWNRVIAAANALLNMKGLKLSENNSFIETGSSSVKISIGQYNPGESYGANAIVFFTPDGDFARTFYALKPVPKGVSPDMLLPFWAVFPVSTPGVWG